jgi:hypothetical protein
LAPTIVNNQITFKFTCPPGKSCHNDALCIKIYQNNNLLYNAAPSPGEEFVVDIDCASYGCQTNSVTNGDFTNNLNGWDVLPQNGVVWNSQYASAEFNSQARLSQNILTPGCQYQISYTINNRSGGGFTVGTDVGGTFSLLDYTSAPYAEVVEISLTLNSGLGNLFGISIDAEKYPGIFIDNVIVCPIGECIPLPPPATPTYTPTKTYTPTITPSYSPTEPFKILFGIESLSTKSTKK